MWHTQGIHGFEGVVTSTYDFEGHKTMLYVGCWNFAFWQHLGSYQGSYWFVTVCTYFEFIVLYLWEIRWSVSWFWYPTHSHYPDTELTSPSLVLVMLGAKLGSDNYQFCKSLASCDQESNTRESCILSIRSPQSVLCYNKLCNQTG